jgi:hypothetical protein
MGLVIAAPKRRYGFKVVSEIDGIRIERPKMHAKRV